MFAGLKGWFGEKATQFAMWVKLKASVYSRIHDFILPCQGGTTQIDHVIVSIFGVFVIETKNMRGWIFGDEQSPLWTQSIYGKKSRFQNPLHQNFRHVKALAEFLGHPDEVFHSVVFFIGDCNFKTPMPSNVLSRGLCGYIRSFRKPILSQQEANDIFTRLAEAKNTPVATHSQHIAGLRERHDGNTCPKCGSSLVPRTARKGGKAGASFLGCSGFPKCRYTRPA